MRLSVIKQLIELVEGSKIGEIEISRFGTRIRISKIQHQSPKQEEVIVKPPPDTEVAVEVPKEKKEERDDNLHTIASPMVGTFYSAPAPDAPPYVEKGDHIKKGDIVCIIEAMKIMNEIESDVSGEIADVLVANEKPVEYNQGLFVIKKA